MTGHVWPLGYEAVYTSPREYRDGMWLQDGTWLPASWHYGCDWAAPTGTAVRAAHDGTLQNLHEDGGAGNYVNIIATDLAHRSMYMHLDGFARDDGPVAAGDVIGYVGSTGASTGPHLHFQVHQPAGGWPSVEPIAWLITSDVDKVPGQVYRWCKSHGLSDAGAAGFMGNIRSECGNPYTGAEMDPAIVEGFTYELEDLEPGVREGVGVIQFSYGRRTALIAHAESVHRPWQQPEVQADYILTEIRAEQRYLDMWDRLTVHTDPVAACRDIAIGDGVSGFTGYIRPGHYGDRDLYAADYHRRILAGEFGEPTPTPPARRPVLAPPVLV